MAEASPVDIPGVALVYRAWYGDAAEPWRGEGTDVTAKVSSLLCDDGMLAVCSACTGHWHGLNDILPDTAQGKSKALFISVKRT